MINANGRRFSHVFITNAKCILLSNGKLCSGRNEYHQYSRPRSFVTRKLIIGDKERNCVKGMI